MAGHLSKEEVDALLASIPEEERLMAVGQKVSLLRRRITLLRSALEKVKHPSVFMDEMVEVAEEAIAHDDKLATEGEGDE